MGLLQMDMGLPPTATGLLLQATGLHQVVPLAMEQPLEGCPQGTGHPQGVEAQGTQPHVTVMAVGEEEGQHLPMNHMMPLSMFTNNSKPPLQVKTFKQT